LQWRAQKTTDFGQSTAAAVFLDSFPDWYGTGEDTGYTAWRSGEVSGPGPDGWIRTDCSAE
jgi:hypothetical protein